MLGFRKLALVQAKLYLREPMAAFFTLLFRPTLLVLLGFIFKNVPDPMYGVVWATWIWPCRPTWP